ncbi:hypothetical protein NL317_31620, partial [Klebsiella pneumoniae]|nr:hypothetical protein [Klebsiella pneumoniae]
AAEQTVLAQAPPEPATEDPVINTAIQGQLDPEAPEQYKNAPIIMTQAEYSSSSLLGNLLLLRAYQQDPLLQKLVRKQKW